MNEAPAPARAHAYEPPAQGGERQQVNEQPASPRPRFVWPPSRNGRTSATPAAPRARPASGWWREIEEVWFGLSAPPFADRAIEAGWEPDHPTTYCPRCARRTGPYDADTDGCAACRTRRLAWDRAVRLGDYRGVLREALHDLKFTAWRRVGRDVGSLLGVAVADALANAGVDPDRAVVVPVPTTLRRRMARGIDHSVVLARAAAEVVGCPVVRALERRHIAPQTALPAGERGAHVRGTMWRRPGTPLAGRVVLLVDDIMTTGATMATACRGLSRRPDGAAMATDRPDQVWACVVGVTPVPGARPVVEQGEPTAIGMVSGAREP